MSTEESPPEAEIRFHIRNEEEGLLDASDEALAIGRASGVPVHISHLKAAGTRNWSKAGPAVAKIEAARHGAFHSKSQSLAFELCPIMI
jgi:N-acyl-D-aspartate/D-glutamate deacylase